MHALFNQGNLRICGAGCFLAAALLLLIHPLRARGQEDRSDALSALRHETLKQDNTPDHYCFVQWYPAELQQRSMESERRNTPEQIQEVVQLFERYTVFLVLDANRGGLTLLDYTPGEVIRRTTTLVSPAGETFAPLDEDALVPAARVFFSASKPLLANLFGSMGKHFEYVICPGKDKSGAKVADPLAAGTLTLKVNSHSFSWHLPLGSLLPPRCCPTCGNTFPGNYEFCPYDGTKLKR